MTNRLQCGIWLSKTIGWKESRYLPEDCRKLIYDWIVLIDFVGSNQSELNFYDYSFIIAPMYKSIEGILWKIATDLGLVKQDSILGNFFDEDHIKKLHPKIDGSKLTRTKKAEVKNELSELKVFLKRYRHNPAHYGSRFSSLEEAKIASHSALHNIKCLIQDLLAGELIIVSEPKDVPIVNNNVNPDDIPF